MKKEQIQATGLLILLLIFIFLESKDIIEPKQYHMPEQNFHFPIDNSIYTTISGSGVGTATVSPSPSPSIVFDEDGFDVALDFFGNIDEIFFVFKGSDDSFDASPMSSKNFFF